VYKDNGESCISEKAFLNRIYDDLRIKALNFAKKGEYGRVIDDICKNNQRSGRNSDRLQYFGGFIMTQTVW
jgi:hypothetical protein